MTRWCARRPCAQERRSYADLDLRTHLHRFDDISVKLSQIDAENAVAESPADKERIACAIRL